MAFHLRQRESIRKGLRRLAKRELRSAAENLNQQVRSDSSIHEARKSIKKVRTIVQVVEADEASGLAKARKRLATVNRVLSRLRDADAMLEILRKLRKRNPHVLSEHTMARLRRRLEAHKREVTAAAERADEWTEVRETLHGLLEASTKWRSSHRSFRALGAGVRATHQRGRNAMARAQRRQWGVDFHRWRKQIKKLMYELRMVAESDPAIQSHVLALHRAETWLGDDHNVDVLCRHLRGESTLGADDLRRLWQAGTRYQRTLRRKAITSVTAIYGVDSVDFVRVLKQSWKAWHKGVESSRKIARKTAA